MTSIRFWKYVLLLFAAYSTNAAAQVHAKYAKSDSLAYEQYITALQGKQNEPMNNLVVATATYFMGKPYVSQTLENETETLVVNLREFDCFTFVENCIALSQVIKSGDFRFEKYCQSLSAIRYRNGIINGYPSRLHYTSEWICANQFRNVFRDISLDLGGEKIEKSLNFMSSHPQFYPHLKANADNVKQMQRIEMRITNQGYNLIPIAQIASAATKIENGDIVVFGTNMAGLDYSHIGIAYRVDDKLTFFHASSSKKKVIIETKSLDAYCKQSVKCGGISIIRLN